MKANKRKRVESAGWRVGSAEEFLQLTPEESALIELRLLLSSHVRQRRENKGLSQIELAKRLGSSQSRVAKIEAGDSSVSIDLLIKALLATGATRKELAKVVGQRTA